MKPKVPVIAPGPLPAQSILGPLLAPYAVPMLQQAVRSGQARLNATQFGCEGAGLVVAAESGIGGEGSAVRIDRS